jgi:PKD repeat protein
MKTIPFFISIIFVLLATQSCNKRNYKACFTTTHQVYSINEQIVFANCSNFDGGFTNCQWNFNDSTNGITYSNGLDSVTHTYTQKGFKTIKLLIGEKENGSESEKIIEIK